MTVTLVVVDDHAVFRQGLRSVLHGHDNISIVGEAADGVEAVSVVASLRPEVVLMDLHLPRRSGVDATAEILAVHPTCAVLALTMLDDEPTVRAALRAGARGYLVKDSGLDDIVAAVLAVAVGHVVLGDGIVPHALATTDRSAPAIPGSPALTDREQQLAHLLVQGATTGQMAARLGISAKTVRNHLSNIYTKLGVQDRGQAVLTIQRALQRRDQGGHHR